MTVAAVVAAAIGAPAATGADRGAAGAEPGAVGADRSAMCADRGALERMRVQRPLHDAADRIEAVVERAGAAGAIGSILVFQDFFTARRDFGIDPVRG
jgi:hypothetical protein